MRPAGRAIVAAPAGAVLPRKTRLFVEARGQHPEKKARARTGHRWRRGAAAGTCFKGANERTVGQPSAHHR
jgi:hypothetical protein